MHIKNSGYRGTEKVHCFQIQYGSSAVEFKDSTNDTSKDISTDSSKDPSIDRFKIISKQLIKYISLNL